MNMQETSELDAQGQSKDPQQPEAGDGAPQVSALWAEAWTATPPGIDERIDPGTEPTRGVDIERTPEPDARDEEKVERLRAPDSRGEQPLPSARNAIDPRGENTPAELFEPPDEPAQTSE